MSIQSIREKINLALYDSKERVLNLFKIGSFLIASLILSLLIYQFGFNPSDLVKEWILIAIKGSFVFYILKYLTDILYNYEPLKLIKETWFEGLLLLLILVNASSTLFFQQSLLNWLGQQTELFQLEDFYILFLQFYFFVLVGIELGKASTQLTFSKMSPPRMLIVSFLALILLGTGFLMMPEMTKNVEYMPFFEALFTSISASCVTGLIVVDTATYFTQKGHIIIMLLIQLGGLNIISFATLFALFSKKGLGIKHQTILQENFSSESLLSGKGLLRKIFLFSFFMEFIGMVLLYFTWNPKLQFPFVEDQFFYSLFHSISAFNNAGFSLFSDGLHEHLVQNSHSMHMVLAGLIFLGAVGFPVIEDLFNFERIKKSIKNPLVGLKLSTQISLYTSLILIAFGMLMFYFLEQENTLNGMKLGGQLITSFFQSITARTAGFNTVDFSIIGTPMLLIFIFLMFIGASPGSTGGGIKTSTFTLIIYSAINTIRGKKKIEIGKRTISPELLHKAFSIFLFSASSIFAAIFVLSISDGEKGIMPIAFEIVSAFSTVGLSTGITADLTFLGKIVIMICMFIGRIGTLTLAFALSSKQRSLNYEYPKAHLTVG
ncbi:MAG: potassium transporter TrkG [Flavobacteriales bacterium]|jgi:trk system potassium uptake protein TrkH|tara:strand:+ start:2447 stop:4258 length:1812 start_codon:yes stop_codon:yes gene_type:complete